MNSRYLKGHAQVSELTRPANTRDQPDDMRDQTANSRDWTDDTADDQRFAVSSI